MRTHIATRMLTLSIAAFTLGTMMLATTWADPTEDAILARVSAFHAAATNGDLDAIADLVAQDDDAVAIGTDPDEVFLGLDNKIVEWWGAIFALLGGGLKTEIKNTIGVDYRVTLVLEKRMGEWDIVQQHFSIGFPNEQLPPDF